MSELNRVFYVEDEPDIQMVARIALETLGGFSVKICSSGDEALREVVAFRPEFILLDVMMPGLDGPGTLAAMQKLPALAQVPVAFMTAKVQPNEIAHFKSLGAIDVIAKPFDPMQLANQVRQLWNRHHGR